MPYGLFDYGGTINTMGAAAAKSMPMPMPMPIPAAKPAPTTQYIPQNCPPTYTDPTTKGVYTLTNCPPKIVTIQPPTPPPPSGTKKYVYQVGVNLDGNGYQVGKIVAYSSQLVRTVPGGYVKSYGDYEQLVADSPQAIIKLENSFRPKNNQIPLNIPVRDYTYGQ
jgi:hypothetical protein